VQGAGAVVGGVTAGVLYQHSIAALVVGIAAIQAIAFTILLSVSMPVAIPIRRPS
jgi:hypothetical protein